MVQLRLPKNSKIHQGKIWNNNNCNNKNNLRKYCIYRWNPDLKDNPKLDTYFVDTQECGPMILDGSILFLI